MEKPRKVLLYSCLFFGAYLSTCLVLRKYIGPRSFKVQLDYKLWREEVAGFDAVFFGSSNTASHIVPQLFDKIVGTKINKFRSFNFGSPCLGVLDTFELLRQVLDQSRPPRLKYVIIEAIHPSFSFRRSTCLGGVESPVAVDLTPSRDLMLRWKTKNFDTSYDWRLIRPFLLNATGTGLLLTKLTENHKWANELYNNAVRSQGFVDRRPEADPKRESVELLPEPYFQAKPPATEWADAVRIYQAINEIGPKYGVKLIYVPAIAGSGPALAKVLAGLPGFTVLDPFANVEQRNQILDPKYFSDQIHLNGPGANLFTQWLAEDFVRLSN